MRPESTPAKIGRLMKNCESFICLTHHVKSKGSLGKMSDRISRTFGHRGTRCLYCRLRGHLREAACGIAHGNAGGSDALAGSDMLQAIDDDEIARGQSLLHDTQAIDLGTKIDE